ncbi:uroplakin-3b-like protein 1 [Meriones unguiculatus]|uniref:uroplakin-3b-like protein 1 n=1 Tax=Meriones unguiculatus TaxID=10047 RepID=UPI00293EFC6B|nr:uroplakin-3b-like protein 1 [Meriones unguiculatus]
MDRSGRTDSSWELGPAMGFQGKLPSLLLLLLVTCVQPGTALESLSYVPQVSNDTLAGRLTQSTFTLEQPLGQFQNVSLSDLDAIWLVVAHSDATQSFAAPQKVSDTHTPANFDRNGYYLTLRASRVHYEGGQPASRLRVLRVGNDNNCSLESLGCNSPLPGAGPYRVKFLAMSDKGPVAETKWSKDIYLQQARAFQGASGSQSKGTVVIIAFLSILLAILLVVFLALVISACIGSTPVPSPAEQVRMRGYRTHHSDSHHTHCGS